jgi:hypothetical protein
VLPLPERIGISIRKNLSLSAMCLYLTNEPSNPTFCWAKAQPTGLWFFFIIYPQSRSCWGGLASPSRSIAQNQDLCQGFETAQKDVLPLPERIGISIRKNLSLSAMRLYLTNEPWIPTFCWAKAQPTGLWFFFIIYPQSRSCWGGLGSPSRSIAQNQDLCQGFETAQKDALPLPERIGISIRKNLSLSAMCL